MKKEEVPRVALISYRQLEELLKVVEGLATNQVGMAWTGETVLASYHRILNQLKECFESDDKFKKAIEHLRPLDEKAPGHELHHRIKADAHVLLGTLRAFIEWYLTPEEKKKIIGFSSDHA